MNRNTTLDEMMRILKAFSIYLSNQPYKDFVISEKFGLLCISSWSTTVKSLYDIVCIDSVERLFEVLVDSIVFDYMAQHVLICIDENEVRQLYSDFFVNCEQLFPEYNALLKKQYMRVVSSVVCHNVSA